MVSLPHLSERAMGISLAQQLVTRLVDDLDGSEAVTTMSFSLDGRTFEIDLSAEHLAEFRAALEPFVAAARRVSGGSGLQRPAGVEPPVARERVAVVAPPPTEQQAPVQDAAAAPAPTSRRDRVPLVADPFNQDLRIV
jgi:hypothetical protein